MSGSRLPVGSSAMIRRGSWTRARAIAVRCCSPPDSWFGVWLGLGREADQREDPVHRRLDPAARRAGHLQGERDVLPDRLRREELEVLEDDPDLATHLRDLAARQPGEVLAVEDDVAAGRDLVADEQLDERGLARAGRADEEHEIPFRDGQVHVAQRDLAVRVLLGDVVQHEDRAFRGSLIRASVGGSAGGARRRRRGGDGHIRLRGRVVRGRSTSVPAGKAPSAGTAGRATSS